MKTTDFPIDELIQLVCKEQNVSEFDYYSDTKMRHATSARHIVIYILREWGFNTKEISRLTGFSEPRVINSIHYLKSDLKNKALNLKRRMHEVYFNTSTEG